MTLETAFKELNAHLETVRQEFVGLQTTIREDKPPESIVFEDTFGDAVDDFLDLFEDAQAAASVGQQAVEQLIDLERAWRALATCQEQFNAVEYSFFDLASYDRLAPLIQFGRQRGGEWLAWTRGVKVGLDRCGQSLYEVNRALFRGWQEIAERVGTTSVSVRATSIGQQMTVPDGEAVPMEGIT